MPRETFDIAVTDFSHSIGLLVRRARAAAASNELSWTETAVLKRIASEGPSTTADLARAQGMRPQSMRTIIAALEEMNMVQRNPHATDGRQVNHRPDAPKAQPRKRGQATQNGHGSRKPSPSLTSTSERRSSQRARSSSA